MYLVPSKNCTKLRVFHAGISCRWPVILAGIMEILIAGAGITGAVTASILRRRLPEQYRLVVWEKARGAGGRMSTSRSQNEHRNTVDLGAQYISSQPAYFARNKDIYDELLKLGLLKSLSGTIEGDKVHPQGTQHFVAPEGVGSIVKHYLSKAGAQVKYEHRLSDIKHEENGAWRVTNQQGEEQIFGGVVLTMPVPQILQLSGAVQQTLDVNRATKERLEAVEYSSRFALGLYYAPGTQIEVPWVAKYVKGDPDVVFVAVDSKKRGCDRVSQFGPSVLVHASVPFSLKHLEEDKEDVCIKFLLPKLQEVIPGLPKPVEMKCHKWRYSQVYKGYEGSPGAVVIQDEPLLICGGDGFTNSGFDRCIESANAIAELIVKKSAL